MTKRPAFSAQQIAILAHQLPNAQLATQVTFSLINKNASSATLQHALIAIATQANAINAFLATSSTSMMKVTPLVSPVLLAAVSVSLETNACSVTTTCMCSCNQLEDAVFVTRPRDGGLKRAHWPIANVQMSS